MDKRKEHEYLNRAEKAKRLLEDQTLQDALQGVENAYLSALKAANGKDQASLHVANLLYCLDQVKRHLWQFVENGKIVDNMKPKTLFNRHGL